MDIRTEHVDIPCTQGGTMKGYLARPTEPGPHPCVIVWMEIFGINSHIRDVVERIAAEGYVTLAADFFHRTMPGVELDYDDAGMAQGMEAMGKLDVDEMILDAKDAREFVTSQSDTTDKVGVIGFCIGGHVTYLTATMIAFEAQASFYGGGIAAPVGIGDKAPTILLTPRIQGKMVCFFGAEDSMIPADQVEAIQEALDDGGVEHEVHVYEGADHGFFCDQRATYNEAAAKDAWEKVKTLFAEELR